MSTESKLWFSCSRVLMWELDHEEGWAATNWLFQVMVLEKTLESSLDCKVIKTVNSKGNQPWIFIGRTDAEAEAPILWLPNAKNWLIVKDPDAGKDWGREKKENDTEDDAWMASPTHWIWIWANCRRWWRTGRPGTLLSMWLQRVGHNLVTEQQQSQIYFNFKISTYYGLKS